MDASSAHPSMCRWWESLPSSDHHHWSWIASFMHLRWYPACTIFWECTEHRRRSPFQAACLRAVPLLGGICSAQGLAWRLDRGSSPRFPHMQESRVWWLHFASEEAFCLKGCPAWSQPLFHAWMVGTHSLNHYYLSWLALTLLSHIAVEVFLRSETR